MPPRKKKNKQVADENIVPVGDNFAEEMPDVVQGVINRRQTQAILGGAGLGARLSQGLTESVPLLENMLLSVENQRLTSGKGGKPSQFSRLGSVVSDTAKAVLDAVGQQVNLQNLGLENNELIREQLNQGDLLNTTLDSFMKAIKNQFGAYSDDSFQPESEMLSAADMLMSSSSGYKDSSSSIGSSRDDFINELTENGVSIDDANAAADAVDVNKDNNLSNTELNNFTGGPNSVVDKLMKDPRFRNSLVKRRPYRSIYEADPFENFNQTAIVNNAAALDNESYNTGNAVFDYS